MEGDLNPQEEQKVPQEATEWQQFFEQGYWYRLPAIFEVDVDKIVQDIKDKGHKESDYFNYGFNPTLWKMYAERIW